MFKTNLQNLLDGALELFNKKKFIEAEKIYKQILEIDNKNAEAYCALGTISAIRKKYDEAINYFNITINYQPQNFYAYNNIGTIFYDFENFSALHLNLSGFKLSSNDFKNASNFRGIFVLYAK